MRRDSSSVGGAWAAILLTGMAAPGVAGAAPPGTRPSPSSPTPSASSAAQAAGYRLGPGDKLRVAVFGVEALGGEVVVPGSGRVPLPLIGEMQAAGLTADQLRTNIETALSDGFVKNPRVSVEVLNYRPFYILGEVNKPGEYPYTSGLTVLNAVARAEGFTYRAKTRVFKRRSTGDRDEHAEKLTAGAPVQPGDTIRIEERSF